MTPQTSSADSPNHAGRLGIDVDFYKSLLNQTLQDTEKQEAELTKTYNLDIQILKDKRNKVKYELQLLEPPTGDQDVTQTPPNSKQHRGGDVPPNPVTVTRARKLSINATVRNFVKASPNPVNIAEVASELNLDIKATRDSLSRESLSVDKGIKKREAYDEKRTPRPLYHHSDSPESAFQEKADELGWTLKQKSEVS